jgi:hypothetical protein
MCGGKQRCLVAGCVFPAMLLLPLLLLTHMVAVRHHCCCYPTQKCQLAGV